MIEADKWIAQWIIGDPDDECINPASLDVRLGGHIIERQEFPRYSGKVVEREHNLKDGETFWLMPERHYMLCTKETTVCPDTHAWLFTLKSSMGRRGIFLSHPGWGDPGFEGQITFNVHVLVPTEVEVGKKFGQIIYMRMKEIPAKNYGQTGRYQNSIGVTKEKE